MAAVLSMTGYAAVQASIGGAPMGNAASAASLGLEIRSVNGRFLDLALRLPDELRACEPALRELVNSQIKRGKVELRASLDSASGAGLQPPSQQLLGRLAELQRSVLAQLPQAAGLSVAEVLRLSSQPERSWPDLQARLLELAREAVQELLAARQREGQRLVAMLNDRCGQLRELTRQAGPLIPQLVEQQKNRFLERWREAMALGEASVPPEAAQERALTEATAYAIRIDVAEELTRLGSHLSEIERLLRAGGDIGKRLDFLIQELHREANTLGSKSATLELSRISVDMKVLIEQMREQVQNIE
jgi:uncharacterized protein (TIGR00255 family)